MAIAVIKTGGKQYKVTEGQTLKIEKIEEEVGKKINLAEVLLVSDDKGKEVQIGTPFLESAKVEAEVLEQAKDKKVTVIKYKAKTRYKRTLGHRQHFTKIKITKIS